MRVRIVRFDSRGLIVKSRFGRPFTISYGEIFTAERLRRASGIRLHTRTADSTRVSVRGSRAIETESQLREKGVRIVDCWGALITPTLADFEAELAQDPGPVRQSSDSA